LAKTQSYGENMTKSSVALHNAYDLAFIFILMMQPYSLNRSTSLLIRLFWRSIYATEVLLELLCSQPREGCCWWCGRDC